MWVSHLCVNLCFVRLHSLLPFPPSLPLFSCHFSKIYFRISPFLPFSTLLFLRNSFPLPFSISWAYASRFVSFDVAIVLIILIRYAHMMLRQSRFNCLTFYDKVACHVSCVGDTLIKIYANTCTCMYANNIATIRFLKNEAEGSGMIILKIKCIDENAIF